MSARRDKPVDRHLVARVTKGNQVIDVVRYHVGAKWFLEPADGSARTIVTSDQAATFVVENDGTFRLGAPGAAHFDSVVSAAMPVPHYA